jgi:DnaJ-class molecular chaperone
MGVRARATDEANWRRCPKCAGTGRYNGDECNVCWNTGWLYVRQPVHEVGEG